MIDFSGEISQLHACNKDFDVLGKRLFDLNPDVSEEQFSTQEMFALSAQLIYVRKRVADIISEIKDRVESEGDYVDLEFANDDEYEDYFMETIHEAFENDHDLLPIIIEEIAVLKRSNLPLSFISRYKDILLSVLQYCNTGDRKKLQKRFRDISVQDML